jgi:hypothetical protein
MTTLFCKITNQIIKMCKTYVTCPVEGNPPVRLWDQDVNSLLTRLEMCIKLNAAYQVTRRTLDPQPSKPLNPQPQALDPISENLLGHTLFLLALKKDPPQFFLGAFLNPEP